MLVEFMVILLRSVPMEIREKCSARCLDSHAIPIIYLDGHLFNNQKVEIPQIFHINSMPSALSLLLLETK